MTLGRNLRIWRHKRQMTQEELQAVTGVSQQYLSEMENGGRNPTIKMLAKIAAALDIQPTELIQRVMPET